MKFAGMHTSICCYEKMQLNQTNLLLVLLPVWEFGCSGSWMWFQLPGKELCHPAGRMSMLFLTPYLLWCIEVKTCAKAMSGTGICHEIPVSYTKADLSTKLNGEKSSRTRHRASFVTLWTLAVPTAGAASAASIPAPLGELRRFEEGEGRICNRLHFKKNYYFSMCRF